MIRRSTKQHSTVLSLSLAAALLSAGPGCLWKHKDDKGAQTKPVSAAKSQKGAPRDRAEEQFEQAANRAPTPKTLYALAQILETQGKDDQAEGVLRRIIADEPRYMPAYCDLAELRLRQRRIEDAYNVLSAGLKISPNEAVLMNDRGMCQVLLKDYDGALLNFTRATAATPDDARYRSNMAMTLAMLGRYDESYSLYTLVMSPKEARENLAVLADSRGDSDQAERFRNTKIAIKRVAVALPDPAAAPAIVPTATPPAARTIVANPVPITPIMVAAPSPATAPAIETAPAPIMVPAIAAAPAPTTAPASEIVAAPATAPTINTASAPATAPAIDTASAPTTAPTIVEAASAPTPSPAIDDTASAPTSAPTIDEAAAAPTTAPTIIEVAAAPTTAPAIEDASAPTTAPAIEDAAVPTTAPAIAAEAAPTTAPAIVAKPAAASIVPSSPVIEQSQQQDEEDPT